MPPNIAPPPYLPRSTEILIVSLTDLVSFARRSYKKTDLHQLLKSDELPIIFHN